MKWSKQIQIWNETPLVLLDIRHIRMKKDEELRSYRLPASSFIYVNQGEGFISLSGLEIHQVHHHAIHTGKGESLSIQCLNEPLDYYMIMYKSLPYPNQLQESSVAESEPFSEIYAFTAVHPLRLLPLLERMLECWRSGRELDKLQVKGLLYQYIYELYHQRELSPLPAQKPDLAVQVAQFIQHNYQQQLSMDQLSQAMHYSTHYVARVFKRRYGCSPMEYLARTRIQQAKHWLTHSDLPIRDVADRVGYKDMYYFSRLFKKMNEVTPAQFKMKQLSLQGSIRPEMRFKSFIASSGSDRYSVISDNDSQHEAWSVNDMKSGLKPTFAAMLLLFSLSLILAACGATEPQAQQSQGNAVQTGDAGATETAAQSTRVYKDALNREIEIPVEPKRAVVITYGGYLLPLGLKPVGVDQAVLDLYPEDMAGVESIGEGLGNLEAISALEPDIIILPEYFDQATYDKYQVIAPTVAVSWGGDPDVINILGDIGEVMNRKAEADAWITKFETKLQGIRDNIKVNLPEGATAITFILYKGEFLLGGKGGTLGKLVYEDFGFQMPSQFEQYADGGDALSMEELAGSNSDYFFTQMNHDELPAMLDLFEQPLYQTIPAVNNDRIINVSRNKWNYGPYLVEEAVDELIKLVNEKME